MDNCQFCKIIKGEVPSETIYEDDIIKAFLDINPTSEGHLLVVPKEHRQNLFEIKDEELHHIIQIIKEKIYPLLKEHLKIDGLTLSQNNDYGQEIKHFHIHVIPRYKKDSFPLKQKNMRSTNEIYEILKKH